MNTQQRWQFRKSHLQGHKKEFFKSQWFLQNYYSNTIHVILRYLGVIYFRNIVLALSTVGIFTYCFLIEMIRFMCCSSSLVYVYGIIIHNIHSCCDDWLMCCCLLRDKWQQKCMYIQSKNQLTINPIEIFYKVRLPEWR